MNIFYNLKSPITLIQYSIIFYFIYRYLWTSLSNLFNQIYCASKLKCNHGHPITGHLSQIVSLQPNLNRDLSISANSYAMLIERAKESNLSVLWLGWYPFYIFSGPAGIEAILNKTHLSKPPLYKLFGIKDGIIASDPHKWRGRRKMIEPFLTSKRFPYFIDVMDQVIHSLPEQISPYIGKPLDLTNLLHESAINIASKVLWGIESDQMIQMKKDLIDCVEKAGHFTSKRALNPIYWSDFTYKLFKIGRDHLKNNEKISSLNDQAYNVSLEKEIKNRQLTLSASKDDNNNNQDSLFTFLKSNADSGKIDIDTEGIKEELLTMLAAGHETTAIGMHWALFSLGHYHEIQERLYQEIIDVFPDNKPINDMDKLKKCTYLDQVIKESLRLYPPVPSILRQSDEDIYFDGAKVPKNSFIVVNIAGTQRDPKVYPNPDEFDPDRWSSENAAKIPKASFVPFALGSRNCIGYRFALIEMKIYLIHIIRRYKLQSVRKLEQVTLLMLLTLRPSCPLDIIFTERK